MKYSQDLIDAVHTIGMEIEHADSTKSLSELDTVIWRLKDMSHNKGMAMLQRQTGDVDSALRYEDLIDSEYKHLPRELQW